MLHPILNATHQFRDRLRLIPGRLKFGDELKGFHSLKLYWLVGSGSMVGLHLFKSDHDRLRLLGYFLFCRHILFLSTTKRFVPFANTRFKFN